MAGTPQSALIVDDEERIAEMVAVILSLEGFDVLTARNGLQGYASYFRNPTDWVITDLEMPELNGVEMIRCIRAINPDVKVVYASGALDNYRSLLEQDARDCDSRWLRKPFTRDDLIELLDSHDPAPPATALRRTSMGRFAVKAVYTRPDVLVAVYLPLL